jgi:hypothetical protein
MRLTARLLHPRGRLRRHSSSCYGWRESPAEAWRGLRRFGGGPRHRGQALTRLQARSAGHQLRLAWAYRALPGPYRVKLICPEYCRSLLADDYATLVQGRVTVVQ